MMQFGLKLINNVTILTQLFVSCRFTVYDHYQVNGKLTTGAVWRSERVEENKNKMCGHTFPSILRCRVLRRLHSMFHVTSQTYCYVLITLSDM